MGLAAVGFFAVSSLSEVGHYAFAPMHHLAWNRNVTIWVEVAAAAWLVGHLVRRRGYLEQEWEKC